MLKGSTHIWWLVAGYLIFLFASFMLLNCYLARQQEKCGILSYGSSLISCFSLILFETWLLYCPDGIDERWKTLAFVLSAITCVFTLAYNTWQTLHLTRYKMLSYQSDIHSDSLIENGSPHTPSRAEMDFYHLETEMYYMTSLTYKSRAEKYFHRLATEIHYMTNITKGVGDKRTEKTDEGHKIHRQGNNTNGLKETLLSRPISMSKGKNKHCIDSNYVPLKDEEMIIDIFTITKSEQSKDEYKYQNEKRASRRRPSTIHKIGRLSLKDGIINTTMNLSQGYDSFMYIIRQFKIRLHQLLQSLANDGENNQLIDVHTSNCGRKTILHCRFWLVTEEPFNIARRATANIEEIYYTVILPTDSRMNLYLPTFLGGLFHEKDVIDDRTQRDSLP